MSNPSKTRKYEKKNKQSHPCLYGEITLFLYIGICILPLYVAAPEKNKNLEEAKITNACIIFYAMPMRVILICSRSRGEGADMLPVRSRKRVENWRSFVRMGSCNECRGGVKSP